MPWFKRLFEQKRTKNVLCFPKGTVVKYDGIPCELLKDTPYYSETLIVKNNQSIKK